VLTIFFFSCSLVLFSQPIVPIPVCPPAGPDSDNDGVYDFVDEDTDNDGISDADEDMVTLNAVGTSGAIEIVGNGDTKVNVGEIYLIEDAFPAAPCEGVDFRFEITGVDNPANTTNLVGGPFNMINIVAANEPWIEYKITVVERGSVTATTPNGIPTSIKNAIFKFGDLDSRPGDIADVYGIDNTFGDQPVYVDIAGVVPHSFNSPSPAPTGSYDMWTMDPAIAGNPTDWVDEGNSNNNEQNRVFLYFPTFTTGIHIQTFAGSMTTPRERGAGMAVRADMGCDTDGDGICDAYDLDSDNDGIPDAIEACGMTGLSLDNCRLDDSGTGNYPDTDSNTCPDGIISTACSTAPADTDGDGIEDFRDLDSDGDGCRDNVEAGTDGSGTSGSTYVSAPVDSDGLLTSLSCPIPGNTDWVNSSVLGGCPDKDNDGIVDYLDEDDDNDGILDEDDGLVCVTFDNFGAPPLTESGSGLGNTGLATGDAQLGDVYRYPNLGTYNGKSIDILAEVVSFGASHNEDRLVLTAGGLSLRTFRICEDDHAVVRYTIVESGTTTPCPIECLTVSSADIDGGANAVEVQGLESGDYDYITSTGSPGVPNVIYGGFQNGTTIPTGMTGVTHPGPPGVDNAPNSLNNRSYTVNYLNTSTLRFLFGVTGLPTTCAPNSSGRNSRLLWKLCHKEDTDGDGVPDLLDHDSDNDGIPDAVEACGNNQLNLDNCSLDWDDSEQYGQIYLGDDNNGNPIFGGDNGVVLSACANAPIDTDGDGIPDFRDLDSDGDGCTDNVEAGTDNMGTSGTAYIPGSVDACGLLMTGISGTCPIPATDLWVDNCAQSGCIDKDNDGISDASDLDADNDGIPDAIECPFDYADFSAILAPITLGPGGPPVVATNYLNGSPLPTSITLDAPTLTGTDTDAVMFTSSGGGVVAIRDQNGYQNGEGPFTTVTLGTASIFEISMGASFGLPNSLLNQNDTLKFTAVGAPAGFSWTVLGSVAAEIYINGPTISIHGDLTAGVIGAAPYSEFSFVPNLPISSFIVQACNATTSVSGINTTRFSLSMCPDTDGDGYSDNLDLDSDNDGIPDAIEACGDISLTLESCANLS